MVDHGNSLLGNAFEICFHRPIQQHLRVGQRLVVDQPVQLAAPFQRCAILTLNGDAVDHQGASIIKKKLHMGSIEIVLAGNQLHGIPPWHQHR